MAVNHSRHVIDNDVYIYMCVMCVYVCVRREYQRIGMRVNNDKKKRNKCDLR